jgi:flagellar motility protein MotE (MotC chaperone)
MNPISRREAWRRIGLGAAAIAVGATPVAAQVLEPENPVGDDVKRFCSNIADAARDRRHALQMAELETLRADIDTRMAALEEKRLEYEEWLARRNDFLERAEENLVEIYRRMRPDAAAERLAEIPPELAAALLMKIGPRPAGVILNEMDATAAATLTTIMASASRRQDPA